MKQIDFYFDFISPFAYLAFEQLPQALAGLSYQVDYKPVLFAGLLQHHGQRGPAEIDEKRAWTYRQVMWLARQHQIEMQMPASHPFNPLPWLRLALACADGGSPNRYVTESIFRHIWRGGQDASDPAHLQALVQALAPGRDLQAPAVKQRLRQTTDEAVSLGLFGVPSLVVDDKLFWGFDALPMLRDYLDGGEWFAANNWQSAAQRPVGATRKNQASPPRR